LRTLKIIRNVLLKIRSIACLATGPAFLLPFNQHLADCVAVGGVCNGVLERGITARGRLLAYAASSLRGAVLLALVVGLVFGVRFGGSSRIVVGCTLPEGAMLRSLRLCFLRLRKRVLHCRSRLRLFVFGAAVLLAGILATLRLIVFPRGSRCLAFTFRRRFRIRLRLRLRHAG